MMIRYLPINSYARGLFYSVLVLGGVYLAGPLSACADAPGPGVRYPLQHKSAPAATVTTHAPAPVAPVTPPDLITECDWDFRLAMGVPVWFFEKESNLPGAGMYADFFNNGRNLNLRIGAEGRHMYLGQDPARSSSENSEKTTRITYLRMPLSVEYIMPIKEDITQLFLGGGPDIIHTANDVNSTDVGAHLSARLLYSFYHQWGVAIEGGYMWGNAQRPGKDINLSGAYITPTLNYTF